MAAKKFYAVRKGKTIGILATWDECKESVHGYSGAEYKSFPTRAEAEAYMAIGAGAQGGRRGRSAGTVRAVGTSGTAGEARVTAKKSERRGSGEELVAYVDGSYHVGTGEFSYGVVLLFPEEDLGFSEKMSDRELAQMRNVAGEIKGAEAAMRYALEHGYKKVVIFHDYEGISKWCLGLWKTNKEGTKAYKAFYDSIKDRLQVEFVKVTGHSNDKYNDMADALAKEALGIG